MITITRLDLRVCYDNAFYCRTRCLLFWSGEAKANSWNYLMYLMDTNCTRVWGFVPGTLKGLPCVMNALMSSAGIRGVDQILSFTIVVVVFHYYFRLPQTISPQPKCTK